MKKGETGILAICRDSSPTPHRARVAPGTPGALPRAHQRTMEMLSTQLTTQDPTDNCSNAKFGSQLDASEYAV